METVTLTEKNTGKVYKIELSREKIDRLKIDRKFAEKIMQQVTNAASKLKSYETNPYSSLSCQKNNKSTIPVPLGDKQDADLFYLSKESKRLSIPEPLTEKQDASLSYESKENERRIIPVPLGDKQDASLFYSSEENEASTISVPVADKQDVSVFKWPHEAILLLIEEYRKRADDFRTGRISQKKVWDAISQKLEREGYGVSGPQCMSKFNGLKKTYKSVKDYNGKSGNGTRVWPYFDMIDGLMGTKPFMEPVATISSTGKRSGMEFENSKESYIAANTRKRNCTVCNKDIISIIEKTKETTEKNHERRHKEKMDQRNKSLALLERLVSALEK